MLYISFVTILAKTLEANTRKEAVQGEEAIGMEDETERHETSKDESEDESVSEEDHEMEVEHDEGSGSVYETDIETTETETEDDLDKTNRLVDCSIYYIDGSVLLENMTKI